MAKRYFTLMFAVLLLAGMAFAQADGVTGINTQASTGSTGADGVGGNQSDYSGDQMLGNILFDPNGLDGGGNNSGGGLPIGLPEGTQLVDGPASMGESSAGGSISGAGISGINMAGMTPAGAVENGAAIGPVMVSGGASGGPGKEASWEPYANILTGNGNYTVKSNFWRQLALLASGGAAIASVIDPGMGGVTNIIEHMDGPALLKIADRLVESRTGLSIYSVVPKKLGHELVDEGFSHYRQIKGLIADVSHAEPGSVAEFNAKAAYKLELQSLRAFIYKVGAIPPIPIM
jgi:hypothetical protein